MEEQTTYLKKLKFDPQLLKSWVARYLSNTRLVLLFLFTIVIAGIFSYQSLERNLNPAINIPLVIVNTVLPGAGPNDIESLVTIPVEDSLANVEKVKSVSSSSRDSVSTITVEFQSGVNADKAKSDVQSVVDGVTLPDDAMTPRVQKIDFENQPVWQFTLTSKSDVASLTQFADNLQKNLEDLDSVDQVGVTGIEAKEIQVLIKPTVLSSYKASPLQLSQAIKSATSSYPAGSIITDSSSYALTIDPAVVNVADLRQIKLNLNDQIVALEDIAVVMERSKPNQNLTYFGDSKTTLTRAINFSIFRNKEVGINKAVEDAQKEVNTQIKAANDQFIVTNTLDTGKAINDQFSELQRDFLLTIFLVFVILFVFLGLRQASVALLATPLTFFITFMIMKATGITLSFISLFSLLLSLGLLVDDTIVVISAMSSYYRTGKFTPLQTGILVWKDFSIPILTTTITTVWAFVPLLLASGIIGEFIKPIPIVVSTTLLASFIVAMLLTLPLIIVLLQNKFPKRVQFLIRLVIFGLVLSSFYFLLPQNSLILLQVLAFLVFLFILVQIKDYLFKQLSLKLKGKLGRGDKNYVEHGLLSFRVIDQGYKRTISRILSSAKNRKLTIVMVIIFSLFSYLLVPFGFVQNEFFPKTNEDLVYVSVELPSGTNLENSEKETINLLNQLKNTPDSEYVLAEVGQGLSDMGGSAGGETNNLLFTIVLPEAKHRHLTSSEIAQNLREQFKDYQTGKFSVSEVSGGPPAGSDLQIELSGQDLTKLDQYASQIKTYLGEQKGVNNIEQSIKQGTSKIVFTPDQTKLASANLTPDAIGLWLRTYASGFNTEKIRLPGETKDTDINFRLSDKVQTVDDLSLLTIPTSTGNVPLTALGTLELKPNPTLITRVDGKRTLTVSASVTTGYNIQTLNAGLEKFANGLNLEAGYNWKTGGVNEENQNSVNSILAAMGLSFLLIITTMVVQFNSFRKAMIVMLVIPLSISGVFIIFALSHTPLSFPALIGVLALFGIVVKNSILVVDKINNNLKTGMEFVESIVDGAVSRLEAIALTSFATIAGLVPITLSDPLWRGLGGAIIAGLTFSGTIMLFFIPVVYYYLFHGEYLKKK